MTQHKMMAVARPDAPVTTVVGEFHYHRSGCWIEPYDDRFRRRIAVPPGLAVPRGSLAVDRIGAPQLEIRTAEELDGFVVNVQILELPEGRDAGAARVIEVLGRPDEFGVDVEILIRKHGIPHRFPPEVLDQARRVPAALTARDAAGRTDFRRQEPVTIDGEAARDFDDAVWVGLLPNGNFHLHVHIADVSHYVRPGTPVDREAALRGTSVYFPDRAVPMLPLELSTEICSLKPGEDRLVMSVLLEIDHRGDVVSQEFTRGVIRSAERLTYTAVAASLEEGSERFALMRELALILNRKRVRRGSIDFDLPEPLIEFDEFGEMIGIRRSPRHMAHRIIEEFMLAANEAVASHLENAGVPAIYRIHEMPEAQRVFEFEQLAAQFGVSLGVGPMPARRFPMVDRKSDGRRIRRDLVLPDEGFLISSRQYQRLLKRIEGQPEERILNYLLLRSLKQARYSAENKGHFALAAPCYTHFTSPIRRYPDLVVHRILGALLDGREPLFDLEQLGRIAEECSFRERVAAEAERELVEWKKLKFMTAHLGDDFAALIVNTQPFGFFVELEELFVEGLVPVDSLPGDRYRYQENTRTLTGERTRRRFAIGDRVRVRLVRVNAIERKLEFAVLVPPPA